METFRPTEPIYVHRYGPRVRRRRRRNRRTAVFSVVIVSAVTYLAYSAIAHSALFG